MVNERREFEHTLDIAEKIRTACIQAAREGFNDASLSGLCLEGAIEAAIGSIQSLNIEDLLKTTRM